MFDLKLKQRKWTAESVTVPEHFRILCCWFLHIFSIFPLKLLNTLVEINLTWSLQWLGSHANSIFDCSHSSTVVMFSDSTRTEKTPDVKESENERMFCHLGPSNWDMPSWWAGDSRGSSTLKKFTFIYSQSILQLHTIFTIHYTTQIPHLCLILAAPPDILVHKHN